MVLDSKNIVKTVSSLKLKGELLFGGKMLVLLCSYVHRNELAKENWLYML